MMVPKGDNKWNSYVNDWIKKKNSGRTKEDVTNQRFFEEGKNLDSYDQDNQKLRDLLDKEIQKIEEIEDRELMREISKAASDYQNKIDKNERIVVGVNDFINENESIDIPILEIDTRAETSQLERLTQVKNNRDESQVKKMLQVITDTCRNGDNLVPVIINAAKNYCTLGEIVDAMKLEFGEWTESSIF